MAPISLVLVALIVLLPVFQPIIAYVQDRKQLRRFPHPGVAGYTSLWRLFQHLRYRQSVSVYDAHKRLGTHVRITPNHLSISSPEAIEAIYGHGTKFLKDAWYDGGAGDYRNLADARDKKLHQGKRRKMAHIFAPKSVQALEEPILERVLVLAQQISSAAKSEKAVNLRLSLNYFTIDVIMAVLFGQYTQCLERDSDVVTAQRADGSLYQSDWIAPLNAGQQVAVPMGYEPHLIPVLRKIFKYHPTVRLSQRFDDIVRYFVQLRMDAGFEESAPDFLFQIIHKDINTMDMGEILAEFSALMNAGSDTMSTSLVHLCYFLHQKKNTHTLKKLREELAPVFSDAQQVLPEYQKLNALPYLRACIEESLRLAPAAPSGLPRTVPPEGCELAGHFIDGGVTVSIPTYTLLRNPDAFDNPDTFYPDRWLEHDPTSAKMALMKKCHLPFSTGARACIGRNLSYFELILITATMAHYFDFEFQDPKLEDDWPAMERANFNPADLWVNVKMRNILKECLS